MSVLEKHSPFAPKSADALPLEKKADATTSKVEEVAGTPQPPAPSSSRTSTSGEADTKRLLPYWRHVLAYFNPPADPNKPVVSIDLEREKRRRVADAYTLMRLRPAFPSSERMARQSALVVRSLMVGADAAPGKAKPTTAITRSQLNKVKTQLLQPKGAGRIITQLRALPAVDGAAPAITVKKGKALPAGMPIHAVCLQYCEDEADTRTFSRLRDDAEASLATAVRDIESQLEAVRLPSVATASIESLTEAFKDMGIVSLITTPDLGLGQPGDGPGLLAGAVPTAETVIDGIVQITPQLMSLGYATGKAILPDHTGVYPPTDRISVLTYWWGLEIVLPPPTLQYLDKAKSISHAVMNFLTALGVINGGVREILPFVRYISQYIEFEFGTIKGQNKGKGVVCAATWIMPAALVPRPWDFPLPPPPKPETETGKDQAASPAPTPAPAPSPPVTVPTPVEPTPGPPVLGPVAPFPDVTVTPPTLRADAPPAVHILSEA